MTRYFAAGNFWFAMGLIAYVGRATMRDKPDMYAFFGAGQWFEAWQYRNLVIAIFAASLFYFVLWAVTAKKNKPSPPNTN
jgi:hypothetical protein